tara:strand:- start:1395 stop:1787 length:393 start_codon:yes stop_codon:yes gene_type:complete
MTQKPEQWFLQDFQTTSVLKTWAIIIGILGMVILVGVAVVHLNQLVNCSWQFILKASGIVMNVTQKPQLIQKVIGRLCQLMMMKTLLNGQRTISLRGIQRMIPPLNLALLKRRVSFCLKISDSCDSYSYS